MLLGRDLSHWDGPAPDLSGLSFVLCKATEGISYDDPSYKAHLALATAKGLIVGSYHFLHPGDGAGQAIDFLDVAKGSAIHLYAVDVEMLADNRTHPTYSDLAAFHHKFHQFLPGHKLIVYSYQSFWEGPFGNPVHSCPDCVLWTSYLHPDTWPAPYGGFSGVTVHQYATTPVDRDRFDGTWAQLAELGSPRPAPAPPVKPKPVPKGATPLLSLNMAGQKVADVQHALDLLGNLTAHTDGMGHFREETLRVLELFQKHRGLKVTGTTTPETWRELRKVAHPKGK